MTKSLLFFCSAQTDAKRVELTRKLNSYLLLAVRGALRWRVSDELRSVNYVITNENLTYEPHGKP